MEDDAIVKLFFSRDEKALAETAGKYGRYLMKIALNILSSEPDSEECVNDTYLRAWNAIPPARPAVLSTFLGKITRNLSIDRLRERQAHKRMHQAEGKSEYDLCLTELEECVPDPKNTEDEATFHSLEKVISDYLRTLPAQQSQLFVKRYFYMEPLQEAAEELGMSQSKAKSMMLRARRGLKAYLEKEEWIDEEPGSSGSD